MRQPSHRRLSPAVYVLGLAALGVVLNQWWGAAGGPVPAAAVPQAVGGADLLLAPPQEVSAGAFAPTPANPAAAVALELVGLGSGQSGRPRALLRVNGGPPTAFGWGDMVSVGVRLARFHPMGVEVQRGNVTEFLPLSVNAQVAALPAAVPASPHGSSAYPQAQQGADEPSIIAHPADQPAPSSNAIDRAIRRATAS